MTEDDTQFGLVLPHFGNRPDPARLLAAAVRAEEAGFDSLWVRDRLVAGAPHGLELEAGGTTFFEPLVTLAAVASVTRRVSLGTAVLLPNRHPLRLLQEVGTLWQLSNGRLRLGLGLGVGAQNFEALGISYDEREDLFVETVAVIRQFAGGGPQTFKGRHVRFDSLEIDPTPGPNLPIYYGGVSPAAVRRAVEYADGWIAGRLPRDTFLARMDLLRELTNESGARLDVLSMPITLVDSGDRRRIAQAGTAIDLLAKSAEGARGWIKPRSGRFETIDDLAGLLIAGSPEDCAREVRSSLEAGVTHLIFDLRLAFSDFEQQFELIADEVLPALR